jgi:hypothetical protein
VQRDACDVDAIDDDAAVIRLVDAADQVQQRRLAAARRAGERDEVAAADRQRDAAQRRGRPRG